MSKVLVVLETTASGLRSSSLPGITCGQKVAAAAGGELHLLVLGANPQGVAQSVADVSATLEQVVRQALHGIERPRKTRHILREPGKVLSDTATASMVVENISEGGAVLHGAAPRVKPGEKLQIAIEGFTDPVPGHVVKSKDGVLHVKFDLPKEMSHRFLEDFKKAIAGKRQVGAA